MPDTSRIIEQMNRDFAEANALMNEFINPLHSFLGRTINVKYIASVSPVWTQGISGEDYEYFKVYLEREVIPVGNYMVINDNQKGGKIVSDSEFRDIREKLIEKWEQYYRFNPK
jgi:hypothetical protein